MARERQLTHEDRLREQAKEYVCINTKVIDGQEKYYYSDDSFLQFVNDINNSDCHEVWKISKEDLPLLRELIWKEMDNNRHDGMKYFECGSVLTVRYNMSDDGIITITAPRQEVQFKLNELRQTRVGYTPKYYKNYMAVTPRKIVKGEWLDSTCLWGISLIREYLVNKISFPKCIVTEA